MKKFYIIGLLTILFFSNSLAYDRVVLMEIFTSTTCPPCASANPYFDNWLKNYSNKDRVAVIKYHTWWPSPGNDPFYYANTVENQARVNYYGTNYVPRGIVNGTGDGTSSPSTWISLIQNSIINSSQFEIKILGNVDAVQGGNLTIQVTADNNPIPTGTLVLHTVVVESDLYYTGTNGDPVHHFVMRKMYPNQNGETFTINPNETKTFSRTFSWNSTWKVDNSYVVVFIQNQSNKQVYQAAIRRANVFLASPNLVFPPNNALNQPINITLRWNKISQATNYGLEVATDSLFTNKIFSDTTLVDTFRTMTKLSRETRYYWRVKAISNYAISNWSPVYSFKTLPQNVPNQVQLLLPRRDTVIANPSMVEFIWQPSAPDVDYYRFELSSDSNFTSYEVDTILTGTSFTYDMRYKLANAYYWRVTAHNGVGWGQSSLVWKINFLRTSVDDKISLETFDLSQNYPNPFNPTTKIEFIIPKSLLNGNGTNRITLKVFDLLGNEVATLIDNSASAGKYEISFDAEKFNLSGGVYFYQLNLNGFQKTRKMIYLK
ncbi:MAG: Omp28-related outer membrane protein [Ignavibacteria bacterium]|nr:Omp28-related outer membrane protein [Ignavibacteria bacterium]